MIKPVLRKIKRLADKFFGTRIDELYWKYRHIFDKKWAEEGYISKEAINHPHRKLLIDKISEYYPFETVLEIGCASGPNLYLLAKKFPKVKFYGTDISYSAIETGKEIFKKANIKNVFLHSVKAEELKNFKNKSIDIIITDALLVYIAPDKINLVIREIFRVTKKAIILCEWYHEAPAPLYKDHWIHDYRHLFSNFVSEEKIKFTKIPPEVWGGNWGKFGYLVEIKP